MRADDFSALQAVVDEVVLGGHALANVAAFEQDHVLGLALVRVQGHEFRLLLAAVVDLIGRLRLRPLKKSSLVTIWRSF